MGCWNPGGCVQPGGGEGLKGLPPLRAAVTPWGRTPPPVGPLSGGSWRSGGARCWSPAGSSPPPAALTGTPSSTRTGGECSVCWSARCCPPPWPPPLSPTNSSSPARAAWARRPWWPCWRGPPCPPPTMRPWVRLGGTHSPPSRMSPGGDSVCGVCVCVPRHRGHHGALAGQATRQRPPRHLPAAFLGLRRRSAEKIRASAAGEGGGAWDTHTQRTPHPPLPTMVASPPPQACKEEADAILFLFSFTDRSSFEELPALMSRVIGPDEENLVKVVVGTKFDLSPQADVTEGDVVAFEGTWGLPVLRAGSGPGLGGAGGGLARVAPLLDALVERLWRRDQIAAGVALEDEGTPPA
ncbi:ciliogenesis and planar polarity effector 2 isoform X1 [Falco cherrug]|uniref:ciliogenesis and planar polarity effector 2 isoform X1 n=1 Tax=Falco cherrug TaxID=345164 RepID=UPI0024797100|nr:ciliogenesis and planar polarity effector 2 isoform X1 [Falco cherrug]